MKKLLLYTFLFLAYTLPHIFAENEECLTLLQLETNPDIVAVLPTESITFNVLENDIGEEIFIKQISKPPPCGNVEILDAAMGTVSYVPNENFDMKIMSFEYEIEDEEGNTATAIVKLVEDDVEKDLIVVVEKDCSMSEENGLYILTVTIAKGTPPFLITGNIDATLEDIGLVNKSIEDGIPYEINVIDGEENSLFVSGGEIGCTKLDKTLYFTDIDDIRDCTCNGNMVVNLKGLDNYDITNIHGFWYDESISNPIQLGDTIPYTASIEIFEVATECYYRKINFLGTFGITGNVSEFCNTPTPIQAIDDFAATIPDESITINLLTNDTGTNLQINQIFMYPSCGEILDMNSETGEVVYLPDSDTECTVDSFVYEVVDDCGDFAEATVTVFIEQPFDGMIVHVERDCTNVEQTGTYTLNVGILSGAPPFTVSGSINEILEGEFPILTSTEINDGTPYTISVMDAEGSEYEESGGEVACLNSPCGFINIESIDEIATCFCNGDISFAFDTILNIDSIIGIEGYWSDGTTSKEIEVGEIIPNDASFDIYTLFTNDNCYTIYLNGSPYIFGYVSDFCNPETYTIEAVDDFANVESGEEALINLLQNDTGTNLQINEILTTPSCGQIMDINIATGVILYAADADTNCFADNFVVEITDDCGNLAESMVTVFIEQETDLNVIVEKDCTSICETGLAALNVAIFGGTPPYIVSGTITDTLETTGVIFAFVENGEPYEIHVVDGDNNEFSQTGGDIPCNFNCCEEIEVESIDGIVECLCDGSAILTLENILNMDTISFIEAYWHNDTGEYLQNGDTIPANSILEIPFVYNEFDCYKIIYEEDYLSVNISDFCTSTPTCLEAIDDFYTVNSGESITVNPQENDLGEGITFIGILGGEEYGTVDIAVDAEISEWVYVANNDASCVTERYEYIIEDAFEQRDTAMVEFYIPAKEMEVVWGFNNIFASCDNFFIVIQGGCPPYTLAGGVETIVENQGKEFIFTHPVFEELYLQIEDNEGTIYELEVSTCNDCPNLPPCNTDCSHILELEYQLGCTDPATNEAGIQIDSVINGEAPFQASFNDNEFIDFVPHQALNQLLVGNNTVLVQDANGCLSDTLKINITPSPDFTLSLQAPIENHIAQLQVEPTHEFNAPFQVSFNSEAYQEASKYIFEIDTLEITEFIVRIKDSIGCESDAFYYAIRDLIFVDIDEISSNIPNIHLFPNPNNGNFSLSLQLQQTEGVNIEVFDVVGRVKMLQEFEGSEELLVELDLGLSSGLYFVRVSGKDWTWTEKMIVE